MGEVQLTKNKIKKTYLVVNEKTPTEKKKKKKKKKLINYKFLILNL